MSVQLNLAQGTLESNTRLIPSMFFDGEGNPRRYRILGGIVDKEDRACDTSICNGAIYCIDSLETCFFTVACDE